jgi:hypothetical protein
VLVETQDPQAAPAATGDENEIVGRVNPGEKVRYYHRSTKDRERGIADVDNVKRALDAIGDVAAHVDVP